MIKDNAPWIQLIKDIALWIQSVDKGQCSMDSVDKDIALWIKSVDKGYCSMDAPWSQSDDKEQQCSMDSVN